PRAYATVAGSADSHDIARLLTRAVTQRPDMMDGQVAGISAEHARRLKVAQGALHVARPFLVVLGLPQSSSCASPRLSESLPRFELLLLEYGSDFHVRTAATGEGPRPGCTHWPVQDLVPGGAPGDHRAPGDESLRDVPFDPTAAATFPKRPLF